MGKKYNNFLKSEWWKELKEKRHKKRKGRGCEVCGNKSMLHIHHYNYRYKYSGKQSKAIKDTKVLCASCHKTFHDIYGVKKDMTKEMIQFTKDTRLAIKEAKKYYKEIMENEEWIKGI